MTGEVAIAAGLEAAAKLPKAAAVKFRSTHTLEAMRIGRLIGNMIVVQSLRRPLNPGETRASLLKKAQRLYHKKEFLSSEPAMLLLLTKTLGHWHTRGCTCGICGMSHMSP